MTEIDEKIREALRAYVRDEEEVGDDDPSDSIQELILASFRGRRRQATLFAIMKMTGSMLLATYGGIMLLLVESTRAMVFHGALFVLGVVALLMWWNWYWMLVNRHAETREIKRLELRIAELAREIRGLLSRPTAS